MESKCVLGCGEMIHAIPRKTQDLLRETGRLDYILQLIRSPATCHLGDNHKCTCDPEILKTYVASQLICLALLKEAIQFNDVYNK